MTSEARRHNLYEEAKQVFSQESADELMGYLPPVGWADVATKADLGLIRSETDALRAELRGEMAELRAELRGEMAELRAELRGEMAELRVELRGEMAELRAELLGEMGGLRGELHRAQVVGLRWTVATVVAMTSMGYAGIALLVR